MFSIAVSRCIDATIDLLPYTYLFVSKSCKPTTRQHLQIMTRHNRIRVIVPYHILQIPQIRDYIAPHDILSAGMRDYSAPHRRLVVDVYPSDFFSYSNSPASQGSVPKWASAVCLTVRPSFYQRYLFNEPYSQSYFFYRISRYSNK